MNTELINLPDFVKIGVLALVFIVVFNFISRKTGLKFQA